MGENKGILDEIFENVIKNDCVIKNPDTLTEDFFPPESLEKYRKKQVRQAGETLAPLLRGRKCSNLLFYGPNGTGKTAVAKLVSLELAKYSITICYANYRKLGTAYKVVIDLCDQIGFTDRKVFPLTGITFGELFSRFEKKLDDLNITLVIIIDEIDRCIRKEERNGNDLLYSLTRMQLSKSKIAMIGIANDANTTEILDPAILSSWNMQEIYFPVYDVEQIKNILRDRAEQAFFKEVVSRGVIELCAGLIISEHNGDIRKAINLLRVSAEETIARSSQFITEYTVRDAYDTIEFDRTAQAIRNLGLTKRILVISVMALELKGLKHKHTTGQVFTKYCELCKITSTDPLVQRRVYDLLAEMQDEGIVNRTLTNKGRYGRTHEVTLAVSREILEKVLQEGKDPDCEKIIKYVHKSRERMTFYDE